MSDQEAEIESQYDVVVNDEEQYSIWPAGKAIPRGWRPVGNRGDKSSCLSYIKEVWTDMRPLSLRKTMEAGGI
jgi:MbtH protein